MYKYLMNGTLIDGTGKNPVEIKGILIKDNRIEKIVLGNEDIALSDLENVEVIDLNKQYILPGFIDSHVHVMLNFKDTNAKLNQPFSYRFYESVVNLKNTIEAGITTVRDAGGADFGIKQAIEDNLIVGPRLKICINPLSITGGHADGWLPSGVDTDIWNYPGSPKSMCDGVEDVRKKAREMLRAGADVLKVHATGGVLSPTDDPQFTQFTIKELQAIVQEGKFRKNIKVMAHAQGTEGIINAVKAGIHSIEHGIYLNDEAIDLMLQNNVFLVPTLLAPLTVVEKGLANDAGIPEYGLKKAKEVLEIHKESIRKAYKNGVKIAMGTDAGVMEHGTNLRELGLLCEVGLTPMEAIVASTKTAAECLEMEEKVGTIEEGKYADLLIINKNPLQNISLLEDKKNIPLIMKDGVIIKNRLCS
ncbi:aryldialkylphosphatase [Lentibacillus populi]|uniref:Aryldialkylphosphatase n=1 Tax=Lentibacillus populi TaxID=1827502 RepID=A0A9W5X4Y1_9BACI|nr:amidohydrolase family protein [Lentibacillus populi]GGB39168.1 aryldialkylphosphatase [Lentibacillus populi]